MAVGCACVLHFLVDLNSLLVAVSEEPIASDELDSEFTSGTGSPNPFGVSEFDGCCDDGGQAGPTVG